MTRRPHRSTLTDAFLPSSTLVRAYRGVEAGRGQVAGVAGDTAEAGGGEEHVGFMVVGFARELRGPAAESGQCLMEGVEAADLAAAKAGEADEDAGDRKSTRMNYSH